MAGSNRQSIHKAVKLQASIDQITNDMLEALVILGAVGKNRAEVAAYVLRQWAISGPAQEMIDEITKAQRTIREVKDKAMD